jgi:hypothetical protein
LLPRANDLIRRMSLAEKVAQLQNGAPGIPRIGLPAHNYWNESLHGVAVLCRCFLSERSSTKCDQPDSFDHVERIGLWGNALVQTPAPAAHRQIRFPCTAHPCGECSQ